MTSQTSDYRAIPNSEAAASVHEDGMVILQTNSGRLFSSNRTGASIWRGIEQSLSIDAIAQQLSSEYRVDRPVAKEHAELFLNELERNNLIQRRHE